MPTYETSGRYNLPALTGSANVVSDIDDWSKAFRDLVTAIIATGYSGALNNRPASSSGTPGILGRFYYATDSKVVYFDTGTSWLALTSVVVGADSSKPSSLATGSLYYADDTGDLYIGANGTPQRVNPHPEATWLFSTGDTDTLGSAWQIVPGLSILMAMRRNQVAVFDAAVMLEHASSNDGTVAFWIVGTSPGTPLTGGAGVAVGTVAGVNGSARIQCPVCATYKVPTDGFYTFSVVATNSSGGGVARGSGSVSWARIVVH